MIDQNWQHNFLIYTAASITTSVMAPQLTFHFDVDKFVCSFPSLILNYCSAPFFNLNGCVQAKGVHYQA